MAADTTKQGATVEVAQCQGFDPSATPLASGSRNILSRLEAWTRQVTAFLLAVRRALNSTRRIAVAGTTTLTATPLRVWQAPLPMPADSLWHLSVVIVGNARENGFRGVYRRMWIRSQELASNDIQTLGTDVEDDATWAITLNVDNDRPYVEVTGDAARTIDWRVFIEILEAPEPR